MARSWLNSPPIVARVGEPVGRDPAASARSTPAARSARGSQSAISGKAMTRQHAGDLHQHERPERPIDVLQRDLGRRHALEVERGRAERRREVADLHVHAEQDAEPDRVVAQVLDDRHEDRHGQQQDPDPVHEHAEHDQDRHHDQHDHDRLERQVGHRVVDEADAAEQVVDADQRGRAEGQPEQEAAGRHGLLDTTRAAAPS